MLGTAPDDHIAQKLGRTRVAVTMRRTMLGIPSANRTGPALTEGQKAQASAPDPMVLEELRAKPVEVPRETLSPEDEERFRLLYGPYYPPRTWRGEFLVCELRGTIRVGGYSDAPIPWPYAFRTGYRSLILCGDLVRAVKLESEQAIAHHWKVSKSTVGKWRQVLNVEMWNAGSRRLLWHAVELARTPEARAKIAKAATGRTLSPEHRQRLIELNRRPKPEAFKKLISDKMLERFASGKRPRPWTSEEEALLGTMPDRELARRLGRTVGAVAERRFLMRAGHFADPATFSWTPEQDAVLSKFSPREAARMLARPVRVVQFRRRALGLRSLATQRQWKPEQDEIIRQHTIDEAARLIGCPTSAVERRRQKLGLTHPKPILKPWTPKELKLLGTKPDRVLARRFGRRTGAVQGKRKSLGIPLCPDKHFWRPADDNLLGKYPDEDVARFLKVSPQSVRVRRSKLGIPIKEPKVRPWTPEEEALLGVKPDAEVATALSRSISAVRGKRMKLGLAYTASRIKYWTSEEESLLRTESDERAAKLLGRSLQSVQLKRRQLDIRAHEGSPTRPPARPSRSKMTRRPPQN